MQRMLVMLALGGLATLPHASAHAADVSTASAKLEALQKRVRALGAAEKVSQAKCRDARESLRRDDAALADVSISDAVRRRSAAAAADQSLQAVRSACDAHEADEALWHAARQSLRKAMVDFERCSTSQLAAACEQIVALADQALDTGAALQLPALQEVAQQAQGIVAELKASAEKAYGVSDKAVSASLKAPAGTEPQQRRALLESARLAHESAGAVWQAARESQSLSNQVVEDTLQASLCSMADGVGGCDGDEAVRRARAAMLGKELARRKAEGAAAMETTKLAAFRVEAGVLKASESERQAALRFLQLIDRNPDAKGLFGGEAIRLSAGKAGGEASIRLDLDRFINNPARDISLIVSAPVGDGNSTALYDTGEGVASGAKATLAYRFTPRLLKSERVLDYLYQFGAHVSVGYSSLPYRRVDDVTTGLKQRSTPWAVGSQVVYADASGTLLHQLGVEYKVEAGYPSDATKTTRCPALPAGQLSVGCPTAYFVAPEQRAGLAFSYNVRFKTSKVAFSPAVTYDRRTRVTSLDVPIYLVGDVEKKALNAGVAFSRQSAGKDGGSSSSAWRLFIGTPFSLLGD